MRLARLASLPILVSVAVGLVVLQGPAQATAPAAAGIQPLVWRDCGGGFECARLTVPLDYDQPAGTTISLKLIKLPATDPGRRIGSLFVNPGGPGDSGVAFVRHHVQEGLPSHGTGEVRPGRLRSPRGRREHAAAVLREQPRRACGLQQRPALPDDPLRGPRHRGGQRSFDRSLRRTQPGAGPAREYRRRRPRPRPDAGCCRGRTAELRGVLLRLLPRDGLREHVPPAGARDRRRRRDQPAGLARKGQAWAPGSHRRPAAERHGNLRVTACLPAGLRPTPRAVRLLTARARP